MRSASSLLSTPLDRGQRFVVSQPTLVSRQVNGEPKGVMLASLPDLRLDGAAAELLGGLHPVVAIGEQELPCNIKNSDRWCLVEMLTVVGDTIRMQMGKTFPDRLLNKIS